MRMLKLVIIDDEAILLQGLLDTYDWEGMGFDVVGTAQSGQQAIDLIQRTHPHVVLTDIRMKKITGLMVMEETQKAGIDSLFIVLSAYRDFEYAQQACELGAYAYLLKPVEDDKLHETMRGAYETCMERLESKERYENWEKLLMKDAASFLQMVVQKYVQNRIPEEKVKEVFDTIGDVLGENDRFISVCVDIDLTYKITNSLDYEASRFAVLGSLEEKIRERYFYWKFEGEDGNGIFIVKTQENVTVRELKTILETVKREEKNLVVASISKPYKGISGMKRSVEEAQKLFGLASASGASAFTVPEEIEEQTEDTYSLDAELLIINAVRKNNLKELKEAFVQFIYGLPHEEEIQCQYLHKVMLRVELMLKDSYGIEESIKDQFRNYYSNIINLNAAKTVDVCYKILCGVIMSRTEHIPNEEVRYFKEYMSVAMAYIEEHLDDEALSIVSVASYVYLNPVYFGRVFKNTFYMTFKKYLLRQRMEKAKRLLEEGNGSIGDICDQVGINNPSYFSHLFKQYTGQLPSEYKKEHES